MNLPLTLSSDQERRVVEEARRWGISPQELLDQAVAIALRQPHESPAQKQPAGHTLPERTQARASRTSYIEWTQTLPHDTPRLSDEALRREAIYRDDREGN